MDKIPQEILDLPLPEGHKWRLDENVMGAYNTKNRWWCWFWYYAPAPNVKAHSVEYHDKNKGNQTHYCEIEDPYEAAQLIVAKMMLGLYE